MANSIGRPRYLSKRPVPAKRHLTHRQRERIPYAPCRSPGKAKSCPHLLSCITWPRNNNNAIVPKLPLSMVTDRRRRIPWEELAPLHINEVEQPKFHRIGSLSNMREPDELHSSIMVCFVRRSTHMLEVPLQGAGEQWFLVNEWRLYFMEMQGLRANLGVERERERENWFLLTCSK